MSESNLRETIRAFIEAHSTLALATVNADGQPEIAPLFYVSDDRLNLYWLSATHVRHSTNLKTHPRVAATIYPAVWEWKDIIGAQIEGEAGAITDERIREQIMRRYLRKFKLPPEFDAAITASTLYGLRPRWIRWVDNSVRFGYKVELDLSADREN
jgi:uncharacterized protein YhbP (UPF0306 family)